MLTHTHTHRNSHVLCVKRAHQRLNVMNACNTKWTCMPAVSHMCRDADITRVHKHGTAHTRAHSSVGTPWGCITAQALCSSAVRNVEVIVVWALLRSGVTSNHYAGQKVKKPLLFGLPPPPPGSHQIFTHDRLLRRCRGWILFDRIWDIHIYHFCQHLQHKRDDWHSICGFHNTEKRGAAA